LTISFLYHFTNAHTCAMSINAEIENSVQQLRKTNAQHKTWRKTWPNYVGWIMKHITRRWVYLA